MPAHLYINPKGIAVNSHSYSSGDLFKTCPRLYFLDKVRGWKRKDKSAALKFGRALESAIQFYHENGLKPDSGVDEFKRLWIKERDNTELRYTAKEVDWKSLYRAGSEMLKLYEIVLPTLPIVKPVFQARVVKEVFPGSELAGIEDQGFIDIISKAPWVHPLLPHVDIPKWSAYRPLGVDIKTSGVQLSVTQDLLTLDPQLRRYAWLSGILDWSFLWFVKSNPYAFQKGTEITLLTDSGKWTAGQSAVVFQYDEESETALIATAEDIEKIDIAFKDISGKGSKERKTILTAGWLQDGTLTSLTAEHFTKQKLQFIAVRIDPEDVIEEGKTVGKTIVEIVEASKNDFFPKQSGVRFPNAKCTFCSHRGLCLKNDKLRDDLLVQISETKPDDEEDWLSEMSTE